PDWVVKLLVGVVFMLLSIFLVGIFILVGYFIQLTQRVMRQEPRPLPEWGDIGGKLILGFKFCVVYFIYLLPIFLLMIPIIIFPLLAEISGNDDMIALVALVYSFAYTLVVIPYSLALTVLIPIIIYRFAERERIGDALDLATIIREFKHNWQNTVIVALIAMAIQSFAGVGMIVFFVGIFFTVMYAYLVSAYLTGALYLERKTEVVKRA
ncbi:MAG: DUF4013 domain-containing protein, partial [Bacteroidota bacterium]